MDTERLAPRTSEPRPAALLRAIAQVERSGGGTATEAVFAAGAVYVPIVAVAERFLGEDDRARRARRKRVPEERLREAATRQVGALLSDLQEEWLRDGVTSFGTSTGDGLAAVGLAPGDARWRAVAFHVAFAYADHGLDGQDGFLDWLRALDGRQPFHLRRCEGSLLELAFRCRVAEPRAVAEEVHRISDALQEIRLPPDVARRRSPTVEDLAEQLRCRGSVVLWWD